MRVEMAAVEIRCFRSGDGPRLAAAWTEAAPQDPITYSRLRDLFLLDRNFDRDGLFIAEADGQIAGAVYAVRRRVAHDAGDTEPDDGWLPFLFVRPEYRGRELGRELLATAMSWLRAKGAQRAYFSSYTPNYFLPGLDAQRYPYAMQMFSEAGFTTQYECVAMHLALDDYTLPPQIAVRAGDLVAQGYRLSTPTDDDLVDLIEVAWSFNSDWSRAIREAVVGGLPLERVITAVDPSGTTLGWAMHGTYEGVIERFGPFGVLPASRGTGLGEVLLHLTLERMKASGTHSAWFLWTEPDSPAGHLYRKTGFRITRSFSVLHANLDQSAPHHQQLLGRNAP